MKKIIVALLFISSTAFAGKMKEIAIIAAEGAEQALMAIGDSDFELKSQNFVNPETNSDFAVKTLISAKDSSTGSFRVWSCVSQFKKNADEIEIKDTFCNLFSNVN